jgi:plasmid stabilization system protein ParE
MGKSGALQGTRELLPHPSYRMVYAVGVDEIAILAIVHTSRQWPPIDDEGA